MKEQAKIYQNLAESLAKLFTPMVEVALYDDKQQLVVIFNRLTHESLPIDTRGQVTKIVLNKNQSAKVMSIALENGYTLRLIAETSLFESFQVLLNQYLGEHTAKPGQEQIVNWQSSVETIIQEYLQQQNVTVNTLSTQQKRCLILKLHEKNLLRYQDATKFLACKLNVSRATIYNYLKMANELKTLEVHQVDAFTNEPFSGNPAGVVLDANHLSDAMMKKITREMNLSETSFLLPSTKADLRLRYFTPNGSEVKFCGHSTVGALYMLAHKQMFNIKQPGYYPLKLETQIGILPVAITLKNDQAITVQFQTPKINLKKYPISHQELAEILGIPLEFIDQTKAIMFEKNNQNLFVTINSLDHLRETQVDQKSAKNFADKQGIVAYALVCKETFSKNSHIHMRCYAPSVGIPEDPFTGSVLGGLSKYITYNQLISANIDTIRIEQGHFISRPGFVDLKINTDTGLPLVIASAHHFFSTKITL